MRAEISSLYQSTTARAYTSEPDDEEFDVIIREAEALLLSQLSEGGKNEDQIALHRWFWKFHDWKSPTAFGEGLTAIVGPNEAGKTTLLAFIRRMLYGFPDGRR